ncbi:hypothetical protein APHAL10511_000701 [Amanita phalloides]|nr:hypothetical protein APHAL10511_000701 [Amanita phalloides]
MASLPVLVESILLCRILIIYTHPSARTVALLPLVSLKIARVVNICILLKAVAANTVYGASVTIQLWKQKNAKIEWILRLVDNSTSAYLLLRNIDFRLGASGAERSGSSLSRLEALFWIATSNFVFPIPLDIALVINGFRRVPYLNGIYIIICSVYVQIIGVLLATIWAAGVQWSEDMDVPNLSLPTIDFSPNPECSTATQLSSASELMPDDDDKSHTVR